MKRFLLFYLPAIIVCIIVFKSCELKRITKEVENIEKNYVEDNYVEELMEGFIKKQTGVDIDLSPSTEEED